jgi:hypothetical protein
MPGIFPITVPAFTKTEALEAAQRQFTMLAYDAANEMWRSPEGLPITPWRFDAIEIPEPFVGVLRKELEHMLQEANAFKKKKQRRERVKRTGNVIQLFPQEGNASTTSEIPPDSDPNHPPKNKT